MRSITPSHRRWKGLKKKEDSLDDPIAESVFGLFLKARTSPRKIAYYPEKIIKTVTCVLSRIHMPKISIYIKIEHNYHGDIENNNNYYK